MQLALSGRALGPDVPLEEQIRVAALAGFPWLLLEPEAVRAFLARPAFDVRDLKRLFLRSLPAALGPLRVAGDGAAQAAQVEALCKEARRLGAPVLLLAGPLPDAESLRVLADVAARWSTVLALAPAAQGLAPTFAEVRRLVEQLDHPALGWVVDTVALWGAGEKLSEADASRTVLLAVRDQDAEGRAVLPGAGVIPLRPMLEPLHRGGYDGLALWLDGGSSGDDLLLDYAKEARGALARSVEGAGWSVPAWQLDG